MFGHAHTVRELPNRGMCRVSGLVMQLLAKAPGERPASAVVLLELLAELG